MAMFLLTSPPVAVALFGVIAYIVWRSLSPSSTLPDLPIVGYDPSQWLAWPRTLFRSFTDFRSLYAEAYDKYLSQGKPCIVPELNDTQVVLPHSLGKWLVDQPDSVLSAQMRQNEFLQTPYTFPTPKMAQQPHHAHVIRTDLTRKLSTLSAEIWTELDKGFHAYWGTDTQEWREVNVFNTMIRIVTRTSNRIFVGEEACRNEEYLDLCTAFAQDVPITGILIRMVPSFLQPLLGPIITLPNRYHTHKIRKILYPTINQRLKIADDDADKPNDFLQWFITYARKSLEPEESTPKFLADRIGTINFAAIHTSTFTAVNAIYDITSIPDKDEVFTMIKTEIENIHAADGGQWTNTSVQRMSQTDSVLRESMRYSSFMTGALQRTVAAKGGVTTPDGLHINHGNVVAIPGLPAHRDAKNYPNPNSFVARRFVDVQPDNEDNSTQRKARSPGTVDTSLSFLSFGHGRHVCPGRFFAANELKLLLAYIAMNYDIEPLEKRPEPVAFGSVMTPNPAVNIRVRRKVR